MKNFTDEIICDSCRNYKPSLSGTDVYDPRTCDFYHVLDTHYINERMIGNEVYCKNFEKL